MSRKIPKEVLLQRIDSENDRLLSELDDIDQLRWLIRERNFGADYVDELLHRLRVRNRLRNIIDLIGSQSERIVGRPSTRIQSEKSIEVYIRAENLLEEFFDE